MLTRVQDLFGRKVLRRRVPPALLGLLPAVLLLPVLASGRPLFSGDFLDYFWYMRSWVTERLRSGRLPTWDPYTLCGFPLVASTPATVFYPPAWLSLILPDRAFWIVSTWLHLAAAGLFAEAWLRRGLRLSRAAALAGAGVFAFSGFLVTHLYGGHVTFFWAYPWGAALLWRLERWLRAPTARRAALLSAPLALIFLTGGPQIFFLASLPALVRLVSFSLPPGQDRPARLRRGAAAAGLMAASLFLAAAQFLPTFELSREAQRTGVVDYAFGTTYSMPPENLLLLAAPSVLGNGIDVPYWGRWGLWETCGTVGVAALVLAVVALLGPFRQRWLWGSLAILSLLVALGRYTPVYRIFVAVFPGAAFFRAPGRYLYIFTLAVAALAGIGLERLRSAAPPGRGLGAFGAALLLVGTGFAVSAIWVGTASEDSWRSVLERADQRRVSERPGETSVIRDDPGRARSQTQAMGSLAWAAGLALLLGGILVARCRGRMEAAPVAGAFGLILAVELLSFSSTYLRGAPTAPRLWPSELVRFILGQPGYPFRVVTVGTSNIPDMGRCRAAGLDHVGGYEPMLLRRYAELMNTLQGQPLGHPIVIAAPSRPHPILFMLGARLWLAGQNYRMPEDFKVLGGLQNRRLYENTRGLPRAWFASESISIPDREERLKFLSREDWDPARTVVLEDESGTAGASRSSGQVRILAREPGAYRMETRSDEGGWLVLSESWYPGWQAWLDGSPVPVRRANHLVQAVRVPAGLHELRMEYRSRTLGLGLWISGASTLALLVLVFRRRRERPGAPPASGA